MRGAKRGEPWRNDRMTLRVGIAVLMAGAIALAYGLVRDVPFTGAGEGHTVTARFTNADGLPVGAPVRVRGVEVGSVHSVRHEAGHAVVDLRLDDRDLDVRADARASIRWRTLLGGALQVALDPGSPSAPALRGEIGTPRTRSQVQFDDLLLVYDGDRPTAQRRTLRGLAGSLDGDGAGRLIDELEPGLLPTAPALRALRGMRHDDLASLIRSTSRVSRAVAAPAALRAVVRNGQATLRTVADSRDPVARILQRAPSSLRALTGAARELRRTLPDLDGLVADLRPATRPLAPALRATRPALVQLDGTLRAARPVLAALDRALPRLAATARSGRPVLFALRPTIGRLDDEILPWLETPDPDTGLSTAHMIGPTVASVAAAAAGHDGRAHLLNFPFTVGDNALAALPCQTALADPTQELRCDALGEALRRLGEAPSRRKTR